MDFLSSNPRTMAFQGAVFSPASFSFLNWQIKRKVFLNSCIRLSAFEFQVLHSIKLHLLPEFGWDIRLIVLNDHGNAGLSLRAGGRGFSPATKRVAPGYFYWKVEEK